MHKKQAYTTSVKGVATLKFKMKQPPLPSLPLLPLSSIPLPLLFPPPLPVRGLGSAVSSPSGVQGEAPAAEQFGAYLSQKEWLW